MISKIIQKIFKNEKYIVFICFGLGHSKLGTNCVGVVIPVWRVSDMGMVAAIYSNKIIITTYIIGNLKIVTCYTFSFSDWSWKYDGEESPESLYCWEHERQTL